MRSAATVALLIWAVLAPAQSNSKPSKLPKKELSPEQQLWCPVIEYGVSGAKSSEPPMRAYLLNTAAFGIEKCDPAMAAPTLVDAFRATLLIPEREEDFERFPASRDQSWIEAESRLRTKRDLQQSILDHLAATDESQAELLLDKAEPSVRGSVLSSMINKATTANKYDHAIELLSRMPAEEFPYDVATELMFGLPSSRDLDKREIFRLAMAADRDRHALIIGSDDFASMIVRFWQHLPPAVALEALHQVLDAASSSDRTGLTLNGASGNVSFTSEYDYRVFELLPVLRQLDESEADKVLSRSQQAQSQLKQFPNGIQSLNPAIGDAPPKEGEIGSIAGSMGFGSEGLQREAVRNAYNSRIKEIVRVSEDNPKQAVAAAAALPSSDSAIPFGSKNPRADALLAVAEAVMKTNPAATKDALEGMAEALKDGAHPYGAMDNWTQGIGTARQIGDSDMALALFQSGMDQVERLASEDADPDDPNLALKAWWPSVSAAWQLVRAASEISPGAALERVRETKDPEILLLLEIGLANKGLGARLDRTIITSVRKKEPRKAWSEYRGLPDE